VIEETDLTPAAVERFWTDVQDGESKTFTLPAGGANYTDVIPSATDGSGGADALLSLVAALSKVTAERDRARDLAARLEEQLARVEALADWHETKAMKARKYRPVFDGENSVMDKAAQVHDDAATRLRAALTEDGA
jgi:hypothetical protein